MFDELARYTLPLLLICQISRVADASQQQVLKDRAFLAYHDNCRAAWRQCSAQPQFPKHVLDFDHSLRRQVTDRGRRATDLIRDVVRSAKGKAVYLSGHSGTLLRDISQQTRSWSAFTLDCWVMAEGGQQNPAIILAAEDVCSPFEEKGWTLGIESTENGGERKGHVFFRLQTHQHVRTSVLQSPLRFEPRTWTHIMIIYNSRDVKLFINGAQVAVDYDQKGDLFGLNNPESCITLQIGGYDGHFYRGAVANVRVQSVALTPDDVQDAMFDRQKPDEESDDKNNVLFFEDFESLDGWEWIGHWPYSGQNPHVFSADIPTRRYDLRLRPPQCGFTICDVPDIVKSYEANNEMRQKKTLRYRIIDVRDSDGSNPTVTAKQIKRQDEVLRQAFAQYNISWELHVHSVYNSSLRRRTVTFGCSPAAVGNGECNPECHFSITHNDGGDCDAEPSLCDASKKGNDHCNDECNVVYHQWDGGDCCNSDVADTSVTCVDPDSKERAYIDLQEYKQMLQLKNDESVNVFFALWNNKQIVGVATFPWEKAVFDVHGGVVVNPEDFGVDGRMDTLVHELGHVLGLWHVHRGVSEAECNDPCFETEPSMEHGDMCADTQPTPQNAACSDPEPDVVRCGFTHFSSTPFKNYMSYADDACVDHFSAQQVSRMHCYIDLQYSRWLTNKVSPPGPPLPPRVVTNSPYSVTISWRPPVSDELFYSPADCSMCNQERSLLQYASVAASQSTLQTHFSSIWHPYEATGPPDAELCSPSYKSWMPDSKLCTNEDCSLTLTFPQAVIPSMLSIWISWNARLGLKDISVLYTDGTSESLGSFQGTCDVPLTVPIVTEKTAQQVVLTPIGPFVSIDAVQLISFPSHQVCAPCKPLRYRVFRQPSFSKPFIADDYEFVDREVSSEESYTYRVQAFLGSVSSVASPPLHYKHRTHFCGDGWIKNDEECDDQNIMDGDGCSAKCTVERNFRCNGEPSVCYWHIGDGICEEFEKEFVTEDCGFVTPLGKKDQWANSVETNRKFYSKACSPDVIIGPPYKSKMCGPELNSSLGWYPCEYFASSDFWLNAYFPEPVVATSVAIYLASDGLSSLTHDNLAQLHLIDTKGDHHHVSHVYLSCHKYPQEIGVMHDLSQPFFLTRGVRLTFSSPEISVAALQLRSSKHLNPVALSSCNDLYSPSLEKCVRYECRRPTCGQPLVKNAKVHCSGEEDGDVCKLVCDDGYHPSSGATMVCVDSSWIGGDPYCKPADCGPPMIPHADAMCPEGTTLGRTCHFKCRPPARLRGNANGNSISCQKNGYWSQPESRCQLTCPLPAGPDHAVLVSQFCRNHETFLFGQRCRFRCKLGFHVTGYSKKRRILQWTCDSTGSWTGEECLPVTCPQPQITKNHYNCTDGFNAGSTCSVHCTQHRDVPKTTRCEADGMWSSHFPACNSETLLCPEPIRSDSNLKITCTSLTIGSACKLSCTQHDKEPVVLAANDSESVLEKLRIVCIDGATWEPAPSSLVCEERCNMEYAKDGYCDAANNHQRCEWDRGDCCPSTVDGGVVKPFPLTCGEECTCRDPSALEKQR